MRSCFPEAALPGVQKLKVEKEERKKKRKEEKRGNEVGMVFLRRSRGF